MKVALVQCPVWGTREPPLALVQLSASLKSKGHCARSFDLNNSLYKCRTEEIKNLWAWEQSMFWYDEKSVKAFFEEHPGLIEGYAAQVLNFNPGLIGFSVAASSWQSSMEFAKHLKKKDPALKIVFGGQLYLDNRFIERSLSGGTVDYVINGEADETLPDMANHIENNKDMKGCPGLFLRDGTSVKSTVERPLIANLDTLPYMDYSDLKLDDYDDKVHISLMASRGCVWHCAFCSSRTFWKGYRFMSGERIHQEITYHRHMQKTGMSHVDFMDLAFNGSMERVREFAKLMVKYPPYPQDYKMQWISNAIIHPGLDRETLELMAKSGCQRLIFGIESGSRNVLKRMRKNYDPEVAVRVIKEANEARIRVTCNFMFGFPGETEEDFKDTLEFLRKIAPYVERVYPSRTYCAIEEFSPLHDNPAEFGIRTPVTHHLYWGTVDDSNNYPVKLKRCQKFEKLCAELGVRVDCGVRTDVEPDEWFNLAYYYEYLKDYSKALEYFERYHGYDPKNRVVIDRMHALKNIGNEPAKLL